jgi:hypothetical protein
MTNSFEVMGTATTPVVALTPKALAPPAVWGEGEAHAT